MVSTPNPNGLMNAITSKKEDSDYSFFFKHISKFRGDASKLRKTIKMLRVKIKIHDFSNKTVQFKQRLPKEDQKANEILNYFHEKNFRAYTTGRGGNAMFNAISIALYGSESQALAIRFITLQYIVQNYDKLKMIHPTLGIKEDVDTTLTNCAANYGISNVLTMYCVAQALQIKINSIYPPLNGICEPRYLEMSSVLEPLNNQPAKAEIHILWMDTKTHGRSWFIPDHFVPLISTPSNDAEENDCTIISTHFPANNTPPRSNTQMFAPDPEPFNVFEPSQVFPTSIALVRHILNHPRQLGAIPIQKKNNCQFVVHITNQNSTKYADYCGPWKSVGQVTNFLELDSGRYVKKLPSGKFVYKSEPGIEMKTKETVFLESRFYVHQHNYTYVRNVYNIGYLCFFQYFGSLDGLDPETPMCELDFTRAAEFILNMKGYTEKPVSTRSNCRHLFKLEEFEDDCMEGCIWKKAHGHAQMILAEEVNGKFQCRVNSSGNAKLANASSYANRAQKTLKLAKSNYLSCCGSDYRKVIYTDDYSCLVQYIGEQPTDCSCQKIREAENLVRDNLSRTNIEIYQENPEIFTNLLEIQTIRQKINPRKNKVHYDLDEELKAIKDRVGDMFVQLDFVTKDSNQPNFILYKKETLYDMFSMLVQGKNIFYITLNMEITCFNVTMFSYLNTKLIWKPTGTSPLFIGPVLLHTSNSVSVFKKFFELVKSELLKVAMEMEHDLGTFEEIFTFSSNQHAAILNSLEEVFPAANRILGAAHLKKSMIKFKDQALRKMLRNLSTSADYELFMKNLEEITASDSYLETPEKTHFENIINFIYKYICKPRWETEFSAEQLEQVTQSANFKIRAYIDPTQLTPSNVVDQLEYQVDLQYTNVKNAIHRDGCYSIRKVENTEEMYETAADPDAIFNDFLRGKMKNLPPLTTTVSLLQQEEEAETSTKRIKLDVSGEN